MLSQTVSPRKICDSIYLTVGKYKTKVETELDVWG